MRGSYRCAHGLYGRFIERREAGDEDKVMAGDSTPISRPF
jgi:hypothetical protein